jgi:hypothetical protein
MQIRRNGGFGQFIIWIVGERQPRRARLVELEPVGIAPIQIVQLRQADALDRRITESRVTTRGQVVGRDQRRRIVRRAGLVIGPHESPGVIRVRPALEFLRQVDSQLNRERILRGEVTFHMELRRGDDRLSGSRARARATDSRDGISSTTRLAALRCSCCPQSNSFAEAAAVYGLRPPVRLIVERDGKRHRIRGTGADTGMADVGEPTDIADARTVEKTVFHILVCIF